MSEDIERVVKVHFPRTLHTKLTLPWRPDRETDGERASDRVDCRRERTKVSGRPLQSRRGRERLTGVPNDIPEEGVEEEEAEIHAEHDGEGERRLVTAKGVAKNLVRAVLHLHADHDAHGVLEREGEEEVRLGELAAKDEDPEHDAGEASLLVELGVRGGEGLAGEVLARLACYSITEESAGGDDGEDDDGED